MKFTWMRNHKTLLFRLLITGILCVSAGIITVSVYFIRNNQVGLGNTAPAPTATTTSATTGVVGGLKVATGNVALSAGDAIDAINVNMLFGSTNKTRVANGVAALVLNDVLNASAKSKCDDMVTKNYWSHNTPSGQQPWIFIQNAGYKYSKSGENLAYGFHVSTDVVTGWMNSPTHKANLLDGAFKDVGFGICSSKNYNNSGPETIVVQHFGTPEVKTPPKPVQKQPPPKPYVAPVCTKIPIPYKTIYKDASYLDVGQTTEYGGTDGYINRCTADSSGYTPPEYTIQPYDKTIYVGTRAP